MWENLAARTITATDTAMKTPVYTVGLMNNTVRAMTVAMSVTKHDAMSNLPTSVPDRLVSISTEYTTASDVVDRAVPGSQRRFETPLGTKISKEKHPDERHQKGEETD